MDTKNPEIYMVLAVAFIAFMGIVLMVSFNLNSGKDITGSAVQGTAQKEVVQENVKMTYVEPDGGIYREPIEVKIFSRTQGATIRYTLDGSDPTEESSIYTQPIKIYKDTDLKVKAFKEGMVPSTTMLARYFIR
jgi:hypothetical protein